MVITPNISNDTTSSGLPNSPGVHSGHHARRHPEANPSSTLAIVEQSAATQSPASAKSAIATDATAAIDPGNDILDANAANAFMTSLRAGVLAQPDTAMSAQANLSPQSVYDLLQ
jgi:hypothetical protein